MWTEILTIGIAIYFIVNGVSEITYTLSLVHVCGALFFLIGGIIVILLGVLIFSKWLESNKYVLGIYIAIKQVIDCLMLTAMEMKFVNFRNLKKDYVFLL